MKRFLTAGIIAAAMMVAMPAAAWAAPFTGSLDYTGTHTPDNANMNLATFSMIFGPGLVGDPEVALATGTFAAHIAVDDPIDHASPFQYRPFGGPYSPLWTHSSGIGFDLETMMIAFSSPGTLVLTGTGTFFGAGYIPTPGLWNMTLNIPAGDLSGSFSSSSSAAAVPEPTLLALFGLGLAAAGTTAARRRRRA